METRARRGGRSALPRGAGGAGTALALGEALAVLLAATATGTAPGPAALAALVAVLVAGAAHLHRPRLVIAAVEDLPGVVVAAAAATAALGVAGGTTALTAVLVLTGLVLVHVAVHGVTHVLRRSGRTARGVLVVGTGPQARRVAATLLLRPEVGLEPVGCLTTGPGLDPAEARGLPVALLGTLDALPHAMTEAGVDAAVLADKVDEDAVDALLGTGATVWTLADGDPDVPGHARHPREVVDGLALVRLERHRHAAPVRAALRLAALVGLLALAVPLLVVAVVVLFGTGGVLVRERWLDAAGRPVQVPRFRTRRLTSVGRPGTTFAVAVPARPGRVGRLLVRTRLVALPTVAWRLLRYAAGARALRSAAAPLADQAQVDAGELAR